MINLTPVATAIVALCAAIVTLKVVPWIKANVSKATLEKASLWTNIAVNAAEQLANTGKLKKEDKYKYVEEFLNSKGFTLDMAEVEALIEGACNQLPKLLEASAVQPLTASETTNIPVNRTPV